MSEMSLKLEYVPSRSRLALGQLLTDRRQEEAETVERAEALREYLGRMEDEEDDVESKDTGIEAAPPPSTVDTAVPAPILPGDGILRLIAMNPLLALAFTHPEGFPPLSSGPAGSPKG